MGCGQSSNTKVNKTSTKTNTRRDRRKLSLSDKLELTGFNVDGFVISYEKPAAAAYQDETQAADTVPATTEQEDTREDQPVQQQNIGSSVMNTAT